jgi:hypothetical protein
MGRLFRIYRNDELVGTQPFDREILKIGRLSSAHIRLDDERVSRIHAVVEISSEGAVNIIDMGSADGTFVNGEKVNKAELKPGDEIRIGDTRLVFVDEDRQNEVTTAEVPAVAAAPANEQLSEEMIAQAARAADVPDLAGEPPAEAVRSEAPPVRPAPHLPAQPPAEEPAEEGRRVALPPPKELGELPDDDRLSPDNWALEVRQLWGDTVLDVKYFSPRARQVVVGEGEKVDFFAPADLLPDRLFNIARLVGSDAVISVGPQASGEIRRRGEVIQLADFVKGGRAGGDFSLPHDAIATVRFGNVGFRFNYRSRPVGYFTRLANRIDYTLLNTLLLVLFIYAGLVATFHLRPKAVQTAEEEVYKVPDRYVAFILQRPKPEKKDLVFLEKLKGDIAEKGQSAERYKGQEGKMGLKGMPDTGKRSAVKAIKPDDREIVGNRGLLAVLGAGGPQGLSTVMGGTGLGGEMEGAIGNMFGSQIGNSGGFGGLGLKGTGPGGGGMGNTIGVGRLGTRGRGGGAFGYGTGVAQIRRRGEQNVDISVGQPIIMGSLSMEIIRQVIHSHRDQIKYCYSKELTRNPNLAGKVTVKFTISPKGYVSQASVSQTTLNNSAVESCIVQKIQTWKFPEPKGGGIVIVNYPFILKSS